MALHCLSDTKPKRLEFTARILRLESALRQSWRRLLLASMGIIEAAIVAKGAMLALPECAYMVSVACHHTRKQSNQCRRLYLAYRSCYCWQTLLCDLYAAQNTAVHRWL